ncbi:4'-phosphopantetheinyl transferase family protein [Ensifer adhaerens]|uniref:4'-phosphopantetheinyl transferase family protein n=1 Tax=Ensifer adhaerens TaxID=106592 RepID=UPI003B846336
MHVEEIQSLAIQLGLDDTFGFHRVLFNAVSDFAHLSHGIPPHISIASPKRQRAFLAGRYCASRALAQMGFEEPPILPVANDGLPIWPEGWIGSISHSEHGAIAVVARRSTCRVLGADMEAIVDDDVAQGIAPIVGDPTEMAILAELPHSYRITLLFSAKEALFKALYPDVREFQDFGAARAVRLDDRCLRLRLTSTWGRNWQKGADVWAHYSIEDQHVYSIVRSP